MKSNDAQPPLDPDRAAAREIKGLKTRIKNLQSELAYVWSDSEDAARRRPR
jgi:hypothetical protein